jgi:hypothetical protein
MADTIEVDLTTLKRILHDGLDLPLNSIQGCVSEVSISSEVLTAILAGDFGGIDRIVGPGELDPARLTPK